MLHTNQFRTPPPHYHSLRHVVTLFVWIFFAFQLTAQEQNLFTEIDPETLALTESQQKVVNYANSLPYKSGLVYVQIGDFWDIQNNGTISFTIPTFESNAQSFQAEHVEYTDADEYTWAGRISDDNGDLVFYSTPEGKIGFIDLITSYYSILPLGGNLALILKHDMKAYPEGECAGSPEGNSSAAITYCDEEDCGAAVVDVLVLVTSGANTWINNAYGAFNQLYLAYGTSTVTNLALFSSGVPNKSIRTSIVMNYTPSFLLTQNNLPGDVLELEQEQEHFSSLKYQYRADIVIMLTNVGYPDGTGYANTIDPDASAKYCIVEARHLLDPRFTFAHEVAHQFGCEHNPGNTNGFEEDCAHGHFLNLGTGIDRPTIMSVIYTNNPDGRIMRYSNPDILFGGVATGIDDERDNARIMRASICSVANNQASPGLSVEIAGPPLLCGLNGTISSNNTYSAIILPPAPGFPGTSPYTYAWYWSPDGSFTPGNYLGSGSSVQINQALNCPGFFLRVVITSSDNITVMRTRKITTALCSACNQSAKGTNTTAANDILNPNQMEQWVVTPNPSNGYLAIKIQPLEDETLSLRIMDRNGNLVQELRPKPGSAFFLNTEGYSNGLYLLHLTGSRFSAVKKIVINN